MLDEGTSIGIAVGCCFEGELLGVDEGAVDCCFVCVLNTFDIEDTFSLGYDVVINLN